MASPSLSILVPTNDRPEVLGKVWPSWLHQEGLTQIVIVNDGSVEDYSGVLRQLANACSEQQVDLKVVSTLERKGAPAARNCGLPLCTGDDVLTLDDDILLTPDVVASCRTARPASNAPVVVGPRVVYLRDDETEEAADARSAEDTRPYADLSTLTVVPWVRPIDTLRVPFVTAVALWPRRLFSDGLRYFEGYRGNGYREETDPQITAQARFGAEIYFVPSAKVFHLPPRIAYARRSGQRRSGLIVFEWHVARNNAHFLSRHGAYLKRTFGVRPTRSWTALLRTRLSPTRARAFIRRKAAALGLSGPA
jgi:glycosyltransferase involved in cell wall biosynthesis